MQDQMLKDDDLRLLNALQIRPRASWSELSRAIGSDPVTLTRRWERLHSQGIAWIAAYRGGPIVSATALLEIECAPAQTLGVAEQIAHDPEVLTVDLTTGNRDLLVTLTCTDLDQLSRYVLERTRSLPMITAMRTQIVSSANSDARNWRLRALDADEIAALEATPPAKIRGVRASEEEQSQLFDILSREPRITVSALAAALGVTPARAGALLSHELSTGRLVVRTEIARPYSGWPVYAWYFLRLEGRKEAIAQRLSHLREARLVASTIGSYDIALAVWLRSIDDVQRLEGYLAEQFPGVSVVDRSIVLRTPHHLHRTIDVSGRSMPKHG
ncbi:Lrp/AsnC family transcriptional regulator [Rhodococcus erythropolis]|nr:Lrp/AsnC family transcriptional regulator [Rhodococcus sp. (in: high G+C Gram-positive bacteria)]UJC81706.1 Lrp/AsnC family transcriptional regulator [Rhodococcus erythropolis]